MCVCVCVCVCVQVHSSGEVIKLEPFCPWKGHLFSFEEKLAISPSVKYVLYKESVGTNWRIQVYALSIVHIYTVSCFIIEAVCSLGSCIFS